MLLVRRFLSLSLGCFSGRLGFWRLLRLWRRLLRCGLRLSRRCRLSGCNRWLCSRTRLCSRRGCCRPCRWLCRSWRCRLRRRGRLSWLLTFLYLIRRLRNFCPVNRPVSGVYIGCIFARGCSLRDIGEFNLDWNRRRSRCGWTRRPRRGPRRSCPRIRSLYWPLQLQRHLRSPIP